MNRYNLSEIMKGAHNMYRTEKYVTFADALRRSWAVAKNRKAIENRRETNEAYLSAKKQAEVEKAAWIANVETASKERLSEQVKDTARVEADCKAYGYRLGNHYSTLSGWGNYCGD